MQYISGISDDKNLVKEKNKQEENNLKYELSMLTVSEVTNHLKNILPEFIIRYTCDNKVNSFYSTLNDLIFINEQKSFQENDIRDLDGLSEYTLPIVIFLLRDCWGHRKVANKNKYLRRKNLDEELDLIIKNDTGIEKKGELGLEIENLITGDNESRIFSDFLSNYCNMENINLLNKKIWVKKNFKEFQKLMIANYKEIYKNDDINKIKNKKREDEMDNDFSIFTPEIFYIDGVKLGPFYKV